MPLSLQTFRADPNQKQWIEFHVPLFKLLKVSRNFYVNSKISDEFTEYLREKKYVTDYYSYWTVYDCYIRDLARKGHNIMSSQL